MEFYFICSGYLTIENTQFKRNHSHNKYYDFSDDTKYKCKVVCLMKLPATKIFESA